MKKILLISYFILSFQILAQSTNEDQIEELKPEPLVPTKLWCIVYFKDNPNLKLILEAESIGAIDRKSESYLTLKGKILDSREFRDVNLYIVRASACTTDIELAKKVRDERNKITSENSKETNSSEKSNTENKKELDKGIKAEPKKEEPKPFDKKNTNKSFMVI